MTWTQIPGGWERVVSFPTAPDNLADCMGSIRVTSLVNGDSVTYDSDTENLDLNPDKSVTVRLPDEIIMRILQEGGAQIQIDVREPSGALNTLLGGNFRVNATHDDLEPIIPPHPRQALRDAINTATTVAQLRAAVLAYFVAIDG